MKKILAALLTHEAYFPILPQVWKNLKKVRIPEGYGVDYVVVTDETNSIDQNTQKFIDDNFIQIHVAPVSYEGFERQKPIDYRDEYTYFTEDQVWKVFQTRNFYRQLAIDGDYDYLLNVDGDVLPSEDALTKLLDADRDYIGGWTYNKKKGGVLLAPNNLRYGTIYETLLSGTYFSLEKRSVFERVPYSLRVDDEKRSYDIRANGYKMYVHPFVYCEHVLEENGQVYQDENPVIVGNKDEVIESEINDLLNKKDKHIRHTIEKNKLKVQKFDSECFSIEYKGEHDCKIYEIEPEIVDIDKWYGPGIKNIDGGVEIELELAKKPDNNVFSFDINSSELDYFYQPFLTSEEKEKMDIYGQLSRPEYIEGSYAVYYKNKKNGIYKTGKVFHIYRPKAIDANGKTVWCELFIENDKLKIIVSQDFLDDAIYPVIIDPTFGYTSEGSSGTTILNNIVGSWFNGPPDTSVGVSVSAYIDHADISGGGYKMALYKHSDLSLITNGTTNEGIFSVTPGAEWLTEDFTAEPALITQEYVVVVWAEIGGYAFAELKYDTGASNKGHTDAAEYGSWPNPLVPTHNSNLYSIYVTFTLENTFGYSTAGASYTGNSSKDRISGSQFTGVAGTVTKMTSYSVSVGSGTGGWVKHHTAIYIHSTLGLLTNGATIESTTAGGFSLGVWVDYTFSSNPTTTAVDYVLVHWGDAAAYEPPGAYVWCFYDDGDYPDSTTQGHYQAVDYSGVSGVFPSTLSATHEDRKYSIFVTYEAESPSANDIRSAKLTGKDTDSSTRAAKLTGKDTDSDTRAARMTGESGAVNVDDSRAGKVTGKSTSTSERDAQLTGGIVETNTRSAKLTGKDADSSTRAAKLAGGTPPAVVLNTTDAIGTSNNTPTLEFTGTDADDDNIRYNIQIDEALWYNTDWNYRQKITIDNTKVPSDQTNIPILVKITDDSNTIFGNAKSDGTDILFTSADGLAKLSHDLVIYVDTEGNEELWAWVKVPTLNGSADTTLYIYYGNAGASAQENKALTWNNGFVFVSHLTTPSGSFVDVSGHVGNSTAQEEVDRNNSGQIYGNRAVEMNGTTTAPTKILFPDDDDLDITSDQTLECLCYPTAWTTTYENSLFTKAEGADYGVYNLHHKDVLGFRYETAGTNILETTPSTTLNTWYYVIGKLDTTGDNMYIVVNNTSNSKANSNAISTNAAGLQIGKQFWYSSNYSPWIGYFNLIRVSNVYRSADWDTVQYNTIMDTSNFFSLSTQETSAALLDKVSGTDAGFTNTTDGDDTDPFDSGDKCDYTVQPSDALSVNTYYWRVRGIDPLGNNAYGDWSAERSFTIIDNNTRGAVLTGTSGDTDSDIRNSKITGQANTSDTRSAKLSGIDITTNNRDAKLTGNTLTLSTRSSKLLGADMMFAERAGKIIGKNADSDTRNSKLTGKVSDSNTRSAKVSGKDSISSIRDAKATGKTTISDTHSAKTIGSQHLRADYVNFELNAADTRNAKIYGTSTDNSERNVKIIGNISVSDARSAKLSGIQTLSSTRSATITGKETDNDERSTKLIGRETANDIHNAKITGKSANASERSSRLAGKDVAVSIRAGHITGKDTNADGRDAKITGKQSELSERNAKLSGIATTFNIRAAKIIVSGSEYDIRDAKISGSVAISSNRNAKITGSLVDVSARSAKIRGQVNITDTRNAKLSGITTTNSLRTAKITGQITDTAERSAKLSGKTSVANERNVTILGIFGSHDTRDVHLTGSENSADEYSAKLTGKVSSADERSSKIIGVDTTNSTRAIKIIGIIPQAEILDVDHGTLLGPTIIDVEREPDAQIKITSITGVGKTMSTKLTLDTNINKIISAKIISATDVSKVIGTEIIIDDAS